MNQRMKRRGREDTEARHGSDLCVLENSVLNANGSVLMKDEFREAFYSGAHGSQTQSRISRRDLSCDEPW